ncbi:DUF6544 family protein [Cyclobacterium sp.]|uniref:DUF6544 family protein n=1 Tax=Cyclobacterium sp. TaxID=1966343 RepID=UPI0019A82841|nr:DUF6544 family protein [Cyclobacterium sp.]MBD3629952.1 hypothetical protein [Cyclobacterium sp.]
MKIIVILVLLIHGAIHLLGFFKAFGWAEVTQLTADISKPLGLVWLLAALLFFLSVILYLLNLEWWVFPAAVAVLVSVFLVISSWADAKYGMVPNFIILAIVVVAFCSWRMDKKISSETSQLFSTLDFSGQELVSEEELHHLPDPVSRWLKTTGIIGKPKIKNGRVKQKVLMKMKPEQKKWYPAEALQYTFMEAPAFIWTVDLSMMPLVHIKGRDMFKDGKGEMLIKLNSLVSIVNEKGDKMDEGTLQRFLGELVWFPSLALSPYIQWKILDDYSAEAIMTYKGTSGSGKFYFDEAGNFVKFSAMRYKGNHARKYPWVLTVDAYSTFEGIKVPSHLKATWQLEEGPWTWLDLELLDIQYNTALTD